MPAVMKTLPSFLRPLVPGAALLLLALALAGGVEAQDLTATLTAELDIERELLADDLRLYAAARQRQDAAMTSLAEALAAIDAQIEERIITLGALEALEEDVLTAEQALAVAQKRADDLRSRVRDRLRKTALLGSRLDTLGHGPSVRLDPLSGRWRFEVRPQGETMIVNLSLNVTLLNGSFQYEDGRAGSFRGTFAGGDVVLERIDSRLGFDSVWRGSLDPARRELVGNWTATDLSSGNPNAGTWTGRKIENRAGEEEDEAP